MYVWVPMDSRKSTGSLVVGVSSDWEPPDVGAGMELGPSVKTSLTSKPSL